MTERARANIWFPFYVADYLRDTMHLTTELHGAYVLLLLAAWTRGGRLPNDDLQLAGIAKMAPAQWRKASPVLRAFFAVAGDEIVQKRMAAEAEKAQRLSDIRSEVGAKGGRPRKQPESKEKPIGSPEQNQNHKQPETQPQSHSSPKSLIAEANASLSPKGDQRPPKGLLSYPAEFEAAWQAYPHVKGRSSRPQTLAQWRLLDGETRTALPGAAARFAREEPRTAHGRRRGGNAPLDPRREIRGLACAWAGDIRGNDGGRCRDDRDAPRPP